MLFVDRLLTSSFHLLSSQITLPLSPEELMLQMAEANKADCNITEQDALPSFDGIDPNEGGGIDEIIDSIPI